MKIFYGIIDNKIDVTDICYNKLINNNIITIPSNDHVRVNFFTDPIYGTLKKIFISNNNNLLEYDDNLNIHIDTTDNSISVSSKLLVLYVFHIYNNFVEHFIKNCIFYDKDIDFILIYNGLEEICEVPDYVKKFFRKNIGYDFGGWSEALLTDNLYLKYSNFIFVNSSVIGPFLKPDFKEKWTDIYINGLQNNIKLFGSTINTCMDPLNKSHIQSYIFAMNKDTLQFLINCEIFSITKNYKTLYETVWNKEVLMSRKIIENGWNISSLLNYYKDVDFTFSNKSPNNYNLEFLDDIMYSKYRGILWDEYQLVFIKGNRISLI